MNKTQELEHSLLFENYHHTLSENIIKYLDKEVLANITLVCSGGNVRAHQIILSACSSFFEDLLTVQSNPNPYVVLNDITKNVMQILLQYMYAGRVSVPSNLVSSVLKAAKILKLRGLNHEEFDNLQSTFKDDALDGSNVTPNFSAILNDSNGHNVGAEPAQQNNPVLVVPEKNNGVWLTANRDSDKPKDHRKKVLNPFAKKASSSTDSDSTVFSTEKAVPGSSKKIPKKTPVLPASPISYDSDVEFVEVNPVVVIPDSQCPNDSSLLAIVEKYIKPRHNAEGSDSDDGELLPTIIKKPKLENVENSGVVQKVKVNPVALKNRSNENLNPPTKKASKYLPSSNNHADEGCVQNKNDKGNVDKEKSNQRACEKSNKDQNKDVPAPSSSKKSNQPKPNRHTTEPFEGFSQMSLRNLRKFCVVCEKQYKHIREHIKNKHCIPSRGKKIVCKVCSKKFSFESSLTYHNCI